MKEYQINYRDCRNFHGERILTFSVNASCVSQALFIAKERILNMEYCEVTSVRAIS